MKAVALKPASDIGPAGKQRKNATFNAIVTPSNPRPDVAPNGPLIKRKASCSCGGGCPSCRSQSINLRVSQPNDPAEIEADQIANLIMRMPVDDAKSLTNLSNTQNTIHRKCDACEEIDDDAEKPVMRKEVFPSVSATPPDTPPSIRNVINSVGQPLDLKTRNFFEPRFDADLSHVRIFTDPAAGQSAKSINARAYTLGSNIVFDRGAYKPESESGKRLLAHELAHVRQHFHSAVGDSKYIKRQEGELPEPLPDPDRTRSPSAATTPRTSLLIHQSIVRAWMREAYRRSDMGGMIPCEYLPRESRRGCFRTRVEREARGLPTRERQEWGGKILQNASGAIHCIFHTDRMHAAVSTCPPEFRLDDEGGGSTNIIGSFHTHPNPDNPDLGTFERPSPADLRAIGVHPECQGRESYVIGIQNIYVIFSDGTWQSLGSTNDWLFDGAPLASPG